MAEWITCNDFVGGSIPPGGSSNSLLKIRCTNKEVVIMAYIVGTSFFLITLGIGWLILEQFSFPLFIFSLGSGLLIGSFLYYESKK